MQDCVRVDWPSQAYSCSGRGSKGGSIVRRTAGVPRRLVHGSEVTGNGRRAAHDDACKVSVLGLERVVSMRAGVWALCRLTTRIERPGAHRKGKGYGGRGEDGQER